MTTEAVVRSSFARYMVEAVIVGATAIVLVVYSALHHRLGSGAVVAGLLGLFSAHAAWHAGRLWRVRESRAFREIETPSTGKSAIGWAYRVQRGGPVGARFIPWTGIVQLRYLDGSRQRLFTSWDNADVLLDHIAERVPNVVIGYSSEAERQYLERRGLGVAAEHDKNTLHV